MEVSIFYGANSPCKTGLKCPAFRDRCGHGSPYSPCFRVILYRISGRAFFFRWPRICCPAGVPVTTDYTPRHPESSLLYRVVAEQLETFLARQQARGRPVPGFIENEFRSFLDCGVLENGFLRLRCESCGKNRLLPYSCKNRGFCPSCCGRKMSDTAAHLVDRVIPSVAVRQWVFSLPHALRYRVAFDAALFTEVLGIMIATVFEFLKRRARDNGITQSKCGAVGCIQRFGSALNLTMRS